MSYDTPLDQTRGPLVPEAATKPAVSSRPAPPVPQKKTITVEFTDAQWARFRDRVAPILQPDEAVVKMFVDAFVDGPADAIEWMRAMSP